MIFHFYWVFMILLWIFFYIYIYTRGDPSIPSTIYSPIEWKKTYVKALKKYGQIKNHLISGSLYRILRV